MNNINNFRFANEFESQFIKEDQQTPPQIKVPFPPNITPEETILIKDGKIPSKPPNSFIIYRRAFQKECRESGHLLKLNVVSSMAAESWKDEPLEVKNFYKELAQKKTKSNIIRAEYNKSEKRGD
ncbi:14571_t:CDS:2 [Ambispora leptoticha]|uniref:14571_t:CDS:1 n=1 Tax=Ambispora leptoticha TaxID=144679 RepID=A0A9N9FSN0_9GLOM|nr:14571_t:CDS:2 [Ambispora leptoticha]